GRIGLDPDRGLRRTGVAKERPDQELSHGETLPPPPPGERRSPLPEMGVSDGTFPGENGLHGDCAMSAPQVPIPPSAPATAPRWASHLLLGLGAVLVPWTLWLAATLPERHVARNFDIAWSGFDVALALTLIATGVGLLRGATWTQGAAAAAATLLVCDAWFDVLTSAPGTERMTAVAMAVLAELPVAVACAM